MHQVVLENKVSISAYEKDVIRIEFNKDGDFYTGNTLFVPERKEDKDIEFSKEENDEFYIVRTSDISIYVKKDITRLNGLFVNYKGELAYTYHQSFNSGELPSIDKTPVIFSLFDNPRIRLPKDGYSVKTIENKERFIVDKGANDLYLLVCDKDYRKLRNLYVSLTGRNELVRMSALGSWNSKYYEYDEKSAMELIDEYKRRNLPLDYLVIDTDWRQASDRGMGYDVNLKDFPDLKSFLADVHQKGVEVMFNDHPEPVDGAKNAFSSSEIKFREKKLQSLLSMGVDTWWYDRNWFTKLKNIDKNLMSETAGMYIFKDITKHYYESNVSDKRFARRPDIMANIVDIQNGRYVGIKDSASHRFGIQWTGDISSGIKSLYNEVSNLIRCSDNCIPYYNSDIGGHTGSPEKDLYLKWMGYGVLSPLMRPHVTKSAPLYREPWFYDEETVDIVRDFLKMRYNLMPYLYSRAFNAYKTGETIFTSIGYQYPIDKKAFKYHNEYMLGKDILISPVDTIKYKLVDSSMYTSKVEAKFYLGHDLDGDVILEKELDEINYLVTDTPIYKEVPHDDYSASFSTTIKSDEDIDLLVSCDDGVRIYLDDILVYEDWSCHAANLSYACSIKSNEEHKLEIEYFQAEGDAELKLFYKKTTPAGSRKIYLPEGDRWIDVYSGNVFDGGKSVTRVYSSSQIPLFVRAGSIIPTTPSALTAKDLDYSLMVYDCYPNKNSSDSFYLYEDDRETVAYKSGLYRTSNYSMSYDKEKNSYLIRLDKTTGEFQSDRYSLSKRDATIKLHLEEEEIDKVLLNGKEVSYKKLMRKKNLLPFNADKLASPDMKVIIVDFRQNVNQDYTIEIKLK